MDILKIREEIKYRPIKDIPLRVVYYARVSSEKDEQLNSLRNQKEYYETFILSNENWTLVDGYIDEGISGISTKHRENFHRMINDAAAGRFDYIITKEISRFARNTLDSIRYTRQLLNDGVAVYFQNDNINTLDEDSEFRLTIMAGVAQDEIRKLSSRVKFGHRQAIKNGVVMGNSLLYGYDKREGKLVVNEGEAEMIKLIFELYATGDYSTPKIETILWDRGYRNHYGAKINRRVIGNIIKNPKYKGYYCGNKVRIIDLFTKKQKFLDEDEWVIWKDEEGLTVPALVSEDVWEKANRIFEKRSLGIKTRGCSYKPNNLFTGKIFCSVHNVPYHLKARKGRNGENTGTMVCRHRIQNGADSCSSFPVRETEIIEVLHDLLTEAYQHIDVLADKYARYVTESYSAKSDNVDARLSEITHEIKKIEAKKDKILELSFDGSLSNVEFKKKNKTFNEEILALEKEKRIILANKDSQKDNASEIIKSIKEKIYLYITNDKLQLTQGIIDSLIDKIYIEPTGEYEANIYVYLRSLGDVSYSLHKEKIVSKNAKQSKVAAPNLGRSVNTLNIIFTERHKEFQRKIGYLNGILHTVKYDFFLLLPK